MTAIIEWTQHASKGMFYGQNYVYLHLITLQVDRMQTVACSLSAIPSKMFSSGPC